MNPTTTEPAHDQEVRSALAGRTDAQFDAINRGVDALAEKIRALQRGALVELPVASLPALTVTTVAKAPSFAALMGTFRAEHDSEVQAAAALMIGATTLSDYCDGLTLPTAIGIKRLAPLVGLPADELAELVESQRAAQARGETIATVAPVRTRVRRLPVPVPVLSTGKDA